MKPCAPATTSANSTTPPKSVTWNGNLDGNWDNATANWQGGFLFLPGDFARFDDTASGTRSVTVVGTQSVGSGGVTVSNAGPAYTFSSGTIAGTSSMTKSGDRGFHDWRCKIARSGKTSQFRYCDVSNPAIIWRHRVVLPTWRGPVNTTIFAAISFSIC